MTEATNLIDRIIDGIELQLMDAEKEIRDKGYTKTMTENMSIWVKRVGNSFDVKITPIMQDKHIPIYSGRTVFRLMQDKQHLAKNIYKMWTSRFA